MSIYLTNISHLKHYGRLNFRCGSICLHPWGLKVKIFRADFSKKHNKCGLTCHISNIRAATIKTVINLINFSFKSFLS